MNSRKPITLHRLRQMHAAGEKIAMLTCYDATFAHTLDEAGVDVLLVGDSLGMVLQGHSTTLPISIDDMVYHTVSVARGNHTAWLIADMPFSSYQDSAESAIHNAVRLMQAGSWLSTTWSSNSRCRLKFSRTKPSAKRVASLYHLAMAT